MHSAHFVFGWFKMALAGPIFVDRKKVDVGMGNINADDFNHGALAKYILEMTGEFFDGSHNGGIIFVAKIIDFVDFDFWNDESVAGGFGRDVEKGEGAIVFVDFVARDFAPDDFSKNAAHGGSPVYLLYYNIFLERCMY